MKLENGDIRAQSDDTAIDPELWDGDIRAQSDDTLNVCRRILTTHIVFKMSVDSGSDEGVGVAEPVEGILERRRKQAHASIYVSP